MRARTAPAYNRSSRPRTFIVRKLIVLIVVLVAAGCGQKGPLVLPPGEVPPRTPAGTPASPSAPAPASVPEPAQSTATSAAPGGMP